MPAILIVDDNPIQAVTRRLILERAHFSVVVAETGSAALSALQDNPSFGMVVSDHCMPEMCGPELVTKMRAAGIQIPVLVLSGLVDAEAEYAGMDVHFHLKPIPPDELISICRLILFPPLDQTA